MRRFRIAVREWLYFQRWVGEQGPSLMSCQPGGSSDCIGSKADPRQGCPKCEFTIHHKRFERKCDDLFRQGATTPQDNYDWPLNLILEYMSTISRANGQTRRGYHPRWSVVTARLVDVYRDEISRVKAIDSWNHKQEMDALLADLPGRRGSHDNGE